MCTTTPTLSRGLSLAILGAADLLDTIDLRGEDWSVQALALDESVTDHIAPFYEDQAAIDFARLTMLRHALCDAPPPQAPPIVPDRVTLGQLCTAALFDPIAFRGV